MSVREIEARLAGSVEDKVSQRLGYRESRVWLPSLSGRGAEVEPRPIVKELSGSEARRNYAEGLLEGLGGGFRPTTLLEVAIPRTYPPETVRTEGVWHLQSEGEPEIQCIPLSIRRTDARWVVTLAPQRRN